MVHICVIYDEQLFITAALKWLYFFKHVPSGPPEFCHNSCYIVEQYLWNKRFYNETFICFSTIHMHTFPPNNGLDLFPLHIRFQFSAKDNLCRRLYKWLALRCVAPGLNKLPLVSFSFLSDIGLNDRCSVYLVRWSKSFQFVFGGRLYRFRSITSRVFSFIFPKTLCVWCVWCYHMYIWCCRCVNSLNPALLKAIDSILWNTLCYVTGVFWYTYIHRIVIMVMPLIKHVSLPNNHIYAGQEPKVSILYNMSVGETPPLGIRAFFWQPWQLRPLVHTFYKPRSTRLKNSHHKRDMAIFYWIANNKSGFK